MLFRSHEIFPYNQVQLQFVDRSLKGLAGKRILDIGCATGELAFQLANANAEVDGIDLNEDLLNQAVTKKKHPGLTFKNSDMMELKKDFQPRQFDAVLCFGNTLVHLASELLAGKMLNGVSIILKPGGIFLLQILNYDYIVAENITELPLIETDNIKFIRRYIIEKNNPLIRFNTSLILKREDEVIENETFLLALRSNELKMLLVNAGFGEVEMFSSFKEEKFGGRHFPLVLRSKIPV